MSKDDPNRPIWMDLPGGSKAKRQSAKPRRVKKVKQRFKVGDIVTNIYVLGHFSGRGIPTMSAGRIKEVPEVGAKYLIVWENGLEGWYDDEVLA